MTCAPGHTNRNLAQRVTLAIRSSRTKKMMAAATSVCRKKTAPFQQNGQHEFEKPPRLPGQEHEELKL